MNVGERVKITYQAHVIEMVVMMITDLQEASQHARDKEWMSRACTLAHLTLGADTKVIWLADPNKTFIGNNQNCINGFPVYLTVENHMIGIDGIEFQFQVQ